MPDLDQIKYIIRGMALVEHDKQLAKDPDGGSPACKNRLGTYTCERCGHDVRGSTGACPAVPREQRWRVDTGA